MCAATLLARFFQIVSEWKWPTPIQLNETYQNPDLARVQWDPTNYYDKSHKMPIITPAYPVMNSSVSVSSSSFEVMMEEFRRGSTITSAILKKNKKVYKLLQKQKKVTLTLC